jgi:hypothetical protein
MFTIDLATHVLGGNGLASGPVANALVVVPAGACITKRMSVSWIDAL